MSGPESEYHTFQQPAPVPGRENVTPRALDLFTRCLDEQCAKGMAKYGTQLQTFNGRNPLRDLMCELVDAFQYATQGELERELVDALVRAVLAIPDDDWYSLIDSIQYGPDHWQQLTEELTAVRSARKALENVKWS